MASVYKIAIIGASSQIAKDLIVSFSRGKNWKLHLFARSPVEVESWLASVGLDGYYEVADFSFFESGHFDAIINFVGVGNPAKALTMGKEIFDITLQFDQIVLDYLQSHSSCKYLFLSSGATYGSNFNEPATVGTPAVFYPNTLSHQEWYGVAKLHTECRHRANPQLNIIDIRIFNYFSRTQDINARFLITDILRAIRDKTVLKTSPDNIVRDYLNPSDFYQLVCVILSAPPTNTALDCYSKAPIDKLSLLKLMRDSFGLKYELTDCIVQQNATGVKPNYYSTNKKAADFGYSPTMTSLETVVTETKFMLDLN